MVGGKGHGVRAHRISSGNIANRVLTLNNSKTRDTNLTPPHFSLFLYPSLSDYTVSLFFFFKIHTIPPTLLKASSSKSNMCISIYLSIFIYYISKCFIFFFQLFSLPLKFENLQLKTASWYQLKKPPKL